LKKVHIFVALQKRCAYRVATRAQARPSISRGEPMAKKKPAKKKTKAPKKKKKR
jgi:hypothetical protein